MPLTHQQIHTLLVACRETHTNELDCEDFLARLAEFAENRAAGKNIPDALSLMLEHERLCPNCAEECRVLVDLIQFDLGEGVQSKSS